MNEERAFALALRQQQLLAKSAALRAQVAGEVAPWKHRLGQADRVRAAVGSGWHWLRRHPEVPAGLAVGLVVMRPARAWRWGWRWGRRVWLGWQLYRRLVAGESPASPAPQAASPAASLARWAWSLTRR